MSRFGSPMCPPSVGGATVAPFVGQTYYAATTGLPGNTGAIGSPWDLQTALNGGPGGNTIQPGDTINIRGGTYNGLYVAKTQGSVLRPIVFQRYQAEQPTIDGYCATTLTAAIDNVVTSIPMAQLNVPDGTLIDIDSETIRIHGYSGGNYTGVDRGWNGTTAAAHLINAPVLTESGNCFSHQGNYTRVIGVEAKVGTSRYANRVNPQAGSNPFGRIAGGFDVQGTGNKVINCIAHDCADGFTTANIVANSFEFHGCIGYYNGWDASDRGHGHNFYIHNDNPATSQALVGSCVSFAAFDFGAQVYTGGTALGNVQVTGFMSAQSGVISTFGAVTELLMGFLPGPITNSLLTGAAVWATGANGFGLAWGYSGGGTDGCTLTNNYVAGQNTACAFSGVSTNLTTSGNTWVGPSSAPNPTSGTFLTWKPASGKTIIISKNQYEVGRANIAIFNWDHSATVSLDFSSFLQNGDSYVVRNAWNYFGASLASGTWNGTPVSVNTSGLTVATPVGKSAPTEPGTEFNIFIVSKT